MAAPTHVVPESVAELLAALGDSDGLTRAACRGRPELFDGELPGEPDDDRDTRHAEALRICAQCPARTACAQLLASIPTRGKDGVWAGRIYRYGTPVPRTDTAA